MIATTCFFQCLVGRVEILIVNNEESFSPSSLFLLFAIADSNLRRHCFLAQVRLEVVWLKVFLDNFHNKLSFLSHVFVSGFLLYIVPRKPVVLETFVIPLLHVLFASVLIWVFRYRIWIELLRLENLGHHLPATFSLQN